MRALWRDYPLTITFCLVTVLSVALVAWVNPYNQPERVVVEVYRNVCGPTYETRIPDVYEFHIIGRGD